MQPDEDEDIAAAIPAAAPVERGRFVLDVSNRDDDDSVDSENNDNENHGAADDVSPPTSPISMRSDDAFEDVGQIENNAMENDWDRVLGPLPRRSSSGDNTDAILNLKKLEVDNGSDDQSDNSNRRKRLKMGFCHCCPNIVRRGPWQMLAAMMGGSDSVPLPRMGNMVVLCPPCFRAVGFGIIGPHWFGPICCLGLLTIATIYFAPKAYHNIGPGSAITCLIFWTVGLVSLCIVSCSDPGVVKSGGGIDGRGSKGYAGVPTLDVTAGKGWRYCDMCSVYQPPSAVHCPECNVCIEGYDHHCPWMGTCIGAKNYNSFLVFNATWLFYLLYSIIWVTFVGATFYAGPIVNSSDDE